MAPRTAWAWVYICLTARFLDVVFAANDWSKPCFQGECAYDLPDHTGTSGILKLSASPRALTDVTPAAGWVILDCDPKTLDQDVRLVCQDDHLESGCRHVFDHGGPIDKLVRLPESCGHGPFARIANIVAANDQSLPTHVLSKIVKRDGVMPQVHTMTIDGNFADIDHLKTGPINMTFVGATVPGLDLNEAFADGAWDDIVGGLDAAKKWVAKAVKTVAKAIADGANIITDGLKDLSNLIKEKSKFNIKPEVRSSNVSLETSPLDWSHPLNLKQCPTGKVGAKLTCKGWLQAKIGIVLVGSLVPPEIKDLATFGGVDGEFDALFNLNLLLEGGFTVKKKIIQDHGLPGLTIPKIITVGPYVSVDGKIQGHLKIDVNLDVHLNYVINELQLWYPKGAADKYAHRDPVQSKQSELTMEATASIKAEGLIQGTITPTIYLGLTIAGGRATANMHVGADAWVRASIASVAEVSVSNKRSLDAPSPKSRQTVIAARNARLDQRDDDGLDANFHGCLWLHAGLHLFGAGHGSIGKWSAKAQFTIFDRYWKLYKAGPFHPACFACCLIHHFRDAGVLVVMLPNVPNFRGTHLLKSIRCQRRKKGCPTNKPKGKKAKDTVPAKSLDQPDKGSD
ncbi:hypothetical protein ONZ45_g10378 [Pleurotus djamor]|nr:hypothetical protein ONZ45_g10378 [Pleurotus djamor]